MNRMFLYTIYVFAVVAAILVWMTTARMKKMIPRQRLIMLMLLAIVVGVVFGYYQVEKLQSLRAMKHWPSVPGQIVKAELKGDRAIVPNVIYTYTVGDSSYSGVSDLGTPAFGNKSKRLNEAETLLAEYPVGTQVAVHYDATNPARSYILAAVPWNAYMQTGIWIFLSLAGAVVLMIFGFRKSKVQMLSALLANTEGI